MSDIRPKDIEWEDAGSSNTKNFFCNDLNCELCNAFTKMCEEVED